MDSNNNVPKDDSHDGSVRRSDDEKRVSGDDGDNGRGNGDLGNRCRKKPETPRRFVTADFVNLSKVLTYSPSGDTTQTCPMSDTTPKSADEMDLGAGCGDVAKVDLRLRVRRFDEEKASLPEEPVRPEEVAAAFQNLGQGVTEILRRVIDQNEEFKEIVDEVEERERERRRALQKVEKERGLLARKLEGAHAEIIGLTSKLEKIKKEKLECIGEATAACRQALESKQTECEMLREKLAQIEEANDTLSKSYEKIIRHLREKNDEQKSQIFDLQIQHSVESPSDVVNEIIRRPKVKDASFQVCAFSAETDKRICSRYGIPSFEDGLRFVRENPVSETAKGSASVNKEGRKSDVFVEAFVANSRLLGEYVEEAEVAVETDNYRKTEVFSPTGKGSMSAPFGVQERTIIDPIVEELDRILQCANNYEESPPKNPRYKCIYTCAKPDSKLEDTNFGSSRSSTFAEPSTPVESLFVIGRDEPRNGSTPNKNFRNSSKRKISVFRGSGVRSSVEKASVVPAIALAMSSGEDTSNSECGPMGIRADQEHRNVADETIERRQKRDKRERMSSSTKKKINCTCC